LSESSTLGPSEWDARMRGRATPLDEAVGRRAATALFALFAGALARAPAARLVAVLSDFLLLLKTVPLSESPLPIRGTVA